MTRDDGSGWMGSLLPLRSDLLRGDLRCLYLGWLLCVQCDEFSGEVRDLPAPRPLGRIIGSLHSLMILRWEAVEVAALASAPLNVQAGKNWRTRKKKRTICS